jgi:hypothetical protein
MKIIVIYPQGNLGATEDEVMSIDVSESMFPEPPHEHHHFLEATFRMMNAVDGGPLERYLRQYQCRSMSVGDLAKVEDRWYRVEGIGWSCIDDSAEVVRLNKLAEDHG